MVSEGTGALLVRGEGGGLGILTDRDIGHASSRGGRLPTTRSAP